MSARHGALSSAFAAATAWRLPSAQRAASPASSSFASVNGDYAADTECVGVATDAAPSQPSPSEPRADSAHGGPLSPARSAGASGDFARLLSSDLSQSGRMTASPKRRQRGVLRLAGSAGEPAAGRRDPKAPETSQTPSSSEEVTVMLTVHPDDSMAWVTVELIAACKARHDRQPGTSDSTQTTAAPNGDEDAACDQPYTPGLVGVGSSNRPEHQHGAAAAVGAVVDGGASASDRSAPADAKPSATDAADPADEAGGAVPPVDDWVSALPAVPKLPIRLAKAPLGRTAAADATAAEVSYADITAQLAGSTTGASSGSEGADDEEGSPSTASEDEEHREQDPRRELELDIAVADALAQVAARVGCHLSGEPFVEGIACVNPIVPHCGFYAPLHFEAGSKQRTDESREPMRTHTHNSAGGGRA